MTASVSQPAAAAGESPVTASRPAMADPGAWAVTAFATTSFMLGMYNTHLLNPAGAGIVIPVAFFFGGLIQIIVAIMEISRGNLFGAVVFGSYGPFWVIYGALESLYATSVPAAQITAAVSLFLAMWAVLSFIFFIAALRTDLVLVVIIGLIFIGLVLLSIGVGASQSGLTEAGGWVTLAFAVLAWYHAAGDIITATFGQKILPVWPIGK
jgi:uncharacterized protein